MPSLIKCLICWQAQSLHYLQNLWRPRELSRIFIPLSLERELSFKRTSTAYILLIYIATRCNAWCVLYTEMHCFRDRFVICFENNIKSSTPITDVWLKRELSPRVISAMTVCDFENHCLALYFGIHAAWTCHLAEICLMGTNASWSRVSEDIRSTVSYWRVYYKWSQSLFPLIQVL